MAGLAEKGVFFSSRPMKQLKPLKKLQNKIMQVTHLWQVIIHLFKSNHFIWDVHLLSQSNHQMLMKLSKRHRKSKKKLSFTEDDINLIETKTGL